VLLLITSCASPAQKSPFDPKNCFENIPSHVKGLKIIEGPRTEQSIIRDMVPAVCRGQALFKHMTSSGDSINPGRVVFKVRVEWNGEVNNVSIVESSVQSNKFLREVSDFIMDFDFVAWSRHDTDTIFFYPANFGF
jgi:hypothetical protein